MPNGPTHRKLTKIALLGTIPAIFVGGSTEVIWFATGIATTLYFDPDLDLRHRLGYVGNAMGLDLYQRIVPRRAGITSRSWRDFSKRDWWKLFLFSHIPFLGTIPRTIIVILPFLMLFLVLSMVDTFPWYGVLWLWLGMSYSDVWHVAADLVTSDFKRRTRNKDEEKWNRLTRKQQPTIIGYDSLNQDKPGKRSKKGTLIK